MKFKDKITEMIILQRHAEVYNDEDLLNKIDYALRYARFYYETGKQRKAHLILNKFITVSRMV